MVVGHACSVGLLAGYSVRDVISFPRTYSVYSIPAFVAAAYFAIVHNQLRILCVGQ